MTVRSARVDDLPRMQACFESFSTASKFFRGYTLERFLESWTRLLQSRVGVIFMLERDGEVLGVLGGVVYPDIYSGLPIATEFFWFTLPEHRGRGMMLYRAFEEWARQMECSEIRMVHMLDSMPEQLNRTYTRLGFTPAEVHYTKELN